MNGVEDEKGRKGEDRGGERRLISEECGEEEQEKKSLHSWLAYFSAVDLLSIEREEELRLAVLQLNPISMHL